jgi:nucleoside-diphosphate-sugar epimerase
MQEYVDVTSIHIRFEKSANLYGEGYEDISHRAPSIHAIESDLGWKPKVGLQEGLKKMIAGMMRTIQHPVLVG